MDVLYWPGWAGGLAIGLFTAAMLYVTGKPLGCSSGYGQACGLIGGQRFFADEATRADPWKLLFILGIPVGGVIAALTSPGSWEPTLEMGALYESVYGDSVALKIGALFVGGVLLGFGARTADGCQSGHAIMGISLMSVPSMVASACFFVGGLVAVQLVFALLGGS